MTTLGFFTRLLDDVPAAERYRIALEQIERADDLGFATAWVAQHHFNGAEGGLPSPLVFLAHAAARTSSIRLGTGVICLPMEDAVRTAEDVAVLDALSDGRVEVGISTGGTPSSFPAFGVDFADRYTLSATKLATVRAAWSDQPINGTDNTLYPSGSGRGGSGQGGSGLNDRIWQATFSADGGGRAGADGDGLMLSRTQPRTADAPEASLADLQVPIIDRYLAELPDGARPKVMASRTIFVADTSQDARKWAEIGLRRAVANSPRTFGARAAADADLDRLIEVTDSFVGSPQQVVEALQADETLARVAEISAQVHSIDAPHREVLRSLDLLAGTVAPALGIETAPRASKAA